MEKGVNVNGELVITDKKHERIIIETKKEIEEKNKVYAAEAKAVAQRVIAESKRMESPAKENEGK